MKSSSNIIDAALRFVRSNPELVNCAREGAPYSDRSVDDLLLDAVERMRDAVEARAIDLRGNADLELRVQPRLYRKRSVAASRRTDSSA